MGKRTDMRATDAHNLSRRGFLTGAALTGAALTLAAGLAACGGTNGTPEATDADSAGAQDGAPGTDEGATSATELTTTMVGSPWVTSNLAGNLDAGYEPTASEDLYVSACGDWLRSQTLAEGQHDLVPRIDEARAAVRDAAISLLEEGGSDDRTLHSLQNTFALMRDDIARDERGLEDLEAELSRIRDIKTLDALTSYLTEPEPTFWGAPFVSFRVVPDAGEGAAHVCVTAVTALTAHANRDEYSRGTAAGADELERARAVFYLVLEDTAMAGEAEGAFGESYAWQTAAASHVRRGAREGEAALRLSRAELASLAGDFPLDGLVDAWGLEAADDFEISSADANALSYLGATYTEKNVDTLRSVVVTSLVHEVALGPLDYLTTDIRDGVREIFGTDVDDATGRTPVRDAAVDGGALTVLTQVLPTAVSRLFCNAFATDARQGVVRGLAHDIAFAYRDLVGAADWLSRETVEEAQRKLDACQVVALRPAQWEDEGLDVATYDDGETLWSARLKLEAAGRRWQALLAGAARRRDEPPRAQFFLDVSCAYDATTNALYVPAGLAATGLIEPDLSPERRLAGAGTLMAREMYRAFAIEGAVFDADGRRRAWWNQDDNDAYNERAERVVAWFDDLYRPLDDQPVKDLGRRVLNETLADFGAMSVALSLAAPSDLDLADLFAGYAQCRMRLMDGQALDQLLLRGNAAPDATAVNLTLAQFDQFQTTFDVVEGDAMHVAPDDRLLIW